MATFFISLAIWAVLNIGTFAAFWIDKNAAIEGTRRVRETTLLGLAFWGGSAGAALAQRVLRHKTRKKPFRTRLLLIQMLHALLAIGTVVVGGIAGIGHILQP